MKRAMWMVSMRNVAAEASERVRPLCPQPHQVRLQTQGDARMRFRRGWKLDARMGVAACLLQLIGGVGIANDQIPGHPQKVPILIRGGTIHPVEGPVIENGAILFEEGRITAVGTSIELPRSGRLIDATGKHVYPGLIESMTGLGLREIGAVGETIDQSEYGDDNPNARAWVAVNPDSELIPVSRAGGVLLANVVPTGSWLKGQSAVMQLDGWTAQEMVLSKPSGLCVDWDAMHPRESDDQELAKRREEKLREFDELIDRVRRYRDARQAEPATTPTDLRLESLVAVIDQTLPIIAEANRQAAIEAAVAYARSQQLRLIIHGGYDAESCAALLKQYQIPVIISSIYRLPLRRHDPYDASFTLPQRLQQAGVQFSIGGEDTGASSAANTRNLPYHAATAVAFGLPREAALRAITMSPAEIFGIADRVGSLAVDKDATLIITDGDILETESNVLQAFIQGREVDLTSRHTMLFDKYRQKYQQTRASRASE